MRAPTAEQWAVIEACDRHVLVDAGAGTGKTFTVVQRLLWMAGVEVGGRRRAGEPVPLPQLAAITFTVNAAQELRARLRAELRAAGRTDLARTVDDMRLGTIHAFCGELLREHALRAGASPDFTVVEPGDLAARAEEAAREALLAAVEEGAPHVADLLVLARRGDLVAWTARLVREPLRLARIAARPEAHREEERALLALATRARAALEEQLRREGCLDYDLLLQRAHALLANEEVRLAVQRSLRLLVVDEFQDTDAVQRDIVWRIGEPTLPLAVTPRLLLVGDAKQSIYGFRGADVTVWNAARDAFLSLPHAAVLPLRTNRRSVPGILAFVDHTIGHALATPVEGTELGPWEAPPAPLVPARAPAGAHAVELVVVSADARGKAAKADPVRQAGAAMVAQRLLALHAAGRPWRGMAVLARARASLTDAQAALEAAGIPCYLWTGEGFFRRREVQDALLALRVLRDPDDDQALAGWLRGPGAALRDDTLVALGLAASAASRSLWWALCEATDGLEPPLAEARAALLRALPLRDRVPAHELLEALCADSGVLAHLDLRARTGARVESREARQALANLRRFLAMLRAQAGATLDELLAWLDDRIASDVEEPQARLFGPEEDVVSLLTVHGAKGLEWPLVAWVDLGREELRDNARIRVGRSAIALKRLDGAEDAQDDAGQETPQWHELGLELARDAAAERKRLWYVAATRAADILLCSALAEGNTRETATPAQLLAERMPEAFIGDAVPYPEGHVAAVRRASAVVVPAPGRLAIGRPAHVEDPAADAAIEEALVAMLPAAAPPLAVGAGRLRHSATELALLERCARRHWLRYGHGLREPAARPPHRPPPPPGLSALVLGQVVHDLLESGGSGAGLEARLEAALAERARGAPPPDTPAGVAWRAEVLASLRAMEAQPDHARLAADPSARREVPFTALLAPDRAVAGFIDLVVRTPEGLVLADVKTAAVSAAEAAAKVEERYARQRDAYVTAAELAGERVVRFDFLFPGEGGTVSTPIDDAERSAARARLDAVLDQLGAAPPALARDPGDCAWCGYRANGWCAGAPGWEAAAGPAWRPAPDEADAGSDDPPDPADA
ncbi:MAG: UvrD-helicase domain-containing protein [Gemmatimonadales bacterium]|nr:UvrD-helicase domain-containing protein [Gemmatimonadales bacterium]